MRGCCHCPGVDVPGVDGCGAGLCEGVVFVFGVRLSVGKTVLVADAGVEGLGEDCEAAMPVEAEGERMREVVDDILSPCSSLVLSAMVVCCAVLVSMLVCVRLFAAQRIVNGLSQAAVVNEAARVLLRDADSQTKARLA